MIYATPSQLTAVDLKLLLPDITPRNSTGRNVLRNPVKSIATSIICKYREFEASSFEHVVACKMRFQRLCVRTSIVLLLFNGQ
jgi:hypothetical protein